MGHSLGGSLKGLVGTVVGDGRDHMKGNGLALRETCCAVRDCGPMYVVACLISRCIMCLACLQLGFGCAMELLTVFEENMKEKRREISVGSWQSGVICSALCFLTLGMDIGVCGFRMVVESRQRVR